MDEQDRIPHPLDLYSEEDDQDDTELNLALSLSRDAYETSERDKDGVPVLPSETPIFIPKPPPPPYRITSLGYSQSDYGCHGSCSFVAMLFVEYLLKSQYRHIESMDGWLQIGCFLYETNLSVMKTLQTKNPFSDDDFINPRAVSELLETTREDLVFVEEISGMVHPPRCIPPSPESSSSVLSCSTASSDTSSVDQQFLQEHAFFPLEKAIRRLFFHALQGTAAGCTFTSSSQYIHAIGVRWQVDVPEGVREHHRKQICPKGPDAYDKEESPTLLELEEKIRIRDLFLVDLIDSHCNRASDGMPCSSGEGIWISFHTLTGLVQYLRKRYPYTLDTDASVSIFQSRKNSFDMVLWTEKVPIQDGVAHGSKEIDGVMQNPTFQLWCDAHRNKKRWNQRK